MSISIRHTACLSKINEKLNLHSQQPRHQWVWVGSNGAALQGGSEGNQIMIVGEKQRTDVPVPKNLVEANALDRLRTEGPDALITTGIEGLVEITLREIEITYYNECRYRIVVCADDIFRAWQRDKFHADLIPKTGSVTRASFALRFADAHEPLVVELCIPNLLIFREDCHADLVRRWVAQSHFLSAAADCR